MRIRHPPPHRHGLTLPFGLRFLGSSIDVSFVSAICSDVTNASTAETFLSVLPFPPPLDGVREVVNLGSLRRRQELPAVVQTPPSCSWVIQSSQSPLFQTWFSFSSSDNFQSFSFCPRDQEVLQFLVHLVCHVEFVLKVCQSDRLLLILCSLHSPASALRAPRRRSLSPDTTKFSSSGRFSFRTGRALRSLAPPTGRATSYRPYSGV